MFMKKAIVIGILTGSGAAVFAQAPVGAPPALPVGGGGASLAPPGSSGSDAGPAPLADGSTPAANAGAEFNIDEFLSGSVQLSANSTSLPGLAEQSAEFVQSQGDSDGGGEPATADDLPSQEDLPDPSQLEQLASSGGGDGGDDSQPSPSQDDVPDQDAVVPTESELENRASAMMPDGDEPDTFATAAEQFVDVVTAAPDMLGGESGADDSSGADGAPEAPNSDSQAPALPENDDGGDGGEFDELSVSFSVPADIEEQAPAPTPFQPSSIANAEVQLTARNPQGPGDEESGSAPEEQPAPDELPQ